MSVPPRRLPPTAARVLTPLRSSLGARDQRLIDGQRFLDRTTQAELYGDPTAAAALDRSAAAGRLVETARRLAGEVRPGLATAVALTGAVSRLAERTPDGDDRNPEQILAAEAATAIERARLHGSLCRALGLPARLCFLYREDPPSLHAVCELRVMNRWSVFDPLANQFFPLSHVGYASAWDIMGRPAIVDGHPDHGRKPTIDSAFYRTVAIASLPAYA